MRSLMLILIAVLLILCAAHTANGAGSDIKFGPTCQYGGYFVPAKGTSLPGIVMIHEWWGLNANIRQEANAYAARGYNVLAVDLFGRSTQNTEEAMNMVRSLDQKVATSHLLAAAQYLRTLPSSSGRVGSLGWCFGGGQSLILAINDPRLNAAVIYYGQPVTDPAQLAKIKAPILGLYGEADQSIPLARVREFDKALTAAGVTHEIHTYPGAGHAFANPTRSDTYKPEAAKDADRRAVAFLAKHLKPGR